MTAEWREVKLDDIAKLRQGKYLANIADQKSPENPYPVWGGNGIRGYCSKPDYSEPVTVITCRGSGCGLVLRTEGAATITNSIIGADVDKSLADPAFFYYLAKSSDFSAVTTGSAQPQITLGHIGNYSVTLPPLGHQKASAEILSTLDDKIELNRRMNETLEAMARALFKSWFVDFDPVRAKMEGRTPDGLSPDLAALFPDTMIDSPLGLIPEGWEVKTLAESVQLNPSERLAKDSLSPYLDMAALPTTGFYSDEARPRKASSGARFRNGDTLLARITPCLENGKTAYVTELEEQQIGWGSTEFIVMRPKAPFPVEYGYLLARDESFRTFAIQSMTGSSGRQRVPVEALGRYETVMPPASLMEQFGIFVRPLFKKSVVVMRENQTLSQLRDTLLPKLISGELRVSDASKIAEAS